MASCQRIIHLEVVLDCPWSGTVLYLDHVCRKDLLFGMIKTLQNVLQLLFDTSNLLALLVQNQDEEPLQRKHRIADSCKEQRQQQNLTCWDLLNEKTPPPPMGLIANTLPTLSSLAHHPRHPFTSDSDSASLSLLTASLSAPLVSLFQSACQKVILHFTTATSINVDFHKVPNLRNDRIASTYFAVKLLLEPTHMVTLISDSCKHAVTVSLAA
jgi:hypothetical protein